MSDFNFILFCFIALLPLHNRTSTDFSKCSTRCYKGPFPTAVCRFINTLIYTINLKIDGIIRRRGGGLAKPLPVV